MKRQALVVGINRYPFLQHLNRPAGDAEAIAQLLEKPTRELQWSVDRFPVALEGDKCRVDNKGLVRQEELKNAILELFQPNPLHVPDVGLLFFAGHGLRQQQYGQTEGFLATSDTNRRGRYGVSLVWLRQVLLNSPVKKQIIWLDCCHSGELLNFLTPDEFRDWLSGGDRLLITACGNDREADAFGEHGVLTEVLLQGLKPENHPAGEWISSLTLVRSIEEQLENKPVLKSRISIFSYFREQFLFWSGTKFNLNGKRQALVVGINHYPYYKDENNNSKHLEGPANDAESIAQMLETYGNFQVKRFPEKLVSDYKLQENKDGYVKTEDLKAEIEKLFLPNEENNLPNTALLFFAGHGWQRPLENATTEGYLLTSDFKFRPGKETKEWGISLQWLRKLLEQSRVEQQIVWLDCGHSGELFNVTDLDNVLAQTKCRCLIAASRGDEEAYGIGKHGLLTKVLLEALDPSQYPNGCLINYSLTNWIPPKFPQVNQHPLYRNSGTPIILTIGIPQPNNRDSNNQEANNRETEHPQPNNRDSNNQETNNRETEHPLDRLWRDSQGWFNDDTNASIMKHGPSHVGNYFPTGMSYQTGEAQKYKNNIENALGLTFPETWWQNKTSIEKLHKSLRCLCGKTFRGNGGNYRISVGAIYLIALVACKKAWPQDPLTCLTANVDWSKLKEADEAIFDNQNPEQQKQFAKALYKLFYCLFNMRDGETNPQIEKVTFDRDGKKLEIYLIWSAKNNLVQRLSESLYIPVELLCDNTTGAIIKLANQIEQQVQITENGFVIGQENIYMQNKVITFQNDPPK